MTLPDIRFLDYVAEASMNFKLACASPKGSAQRMEWIEKAEKCAASARAILPAMISEPLAVELLVAEKGCVQLRLREKETPLA